MKTLISYLNQLNFSHTEALLYVLLLKHGPLTVKELAEKAKINRTAMYPHISSLINKSIFLEIIQDGHKKLVASEPDRLQGIINEQLAEIHARQDKLPTILTSLNALSPEREKKNTSEIKYYKGRTAVKRIYDDCLRSKKIRAYYDPDALEKVFPENKSLFCKKIKQNSEMIVLEIIQPSIQTYIEIKRSLNTPRHIYKALPKDIKLTANDILIYDDKVAIINIGDKQHVTGIVLDNKDYYNNSVQLFDLLWRLLPEPTDK
jgi:sugar-specific transcriptional regulator TrmB